jgi:hypothetical protein
VSRLDALPGSLRIGATTYRVDPMDASEAHDNHRWGDHNPRTSVIRIAEDCGQDRAAVTLMHEALHGMFLDAGLDVEEEEAVVRGLAPRVVAFLRDNPDAVAWIMKPEGDR